MNKIINGIDHQSLMKRQLPHHFIGYPSQEKVARLMFRHGMRIAEGKVYCGEVEVSDSALGRAARVDRRIVRSTLARIEGNPELNDLFTRLRPIPLLASVAQVMGWSVLEIVPTNASSTGILADVSTVIAEAGVSIRQAVVDDPELTDEPRLLVVTEGPVPPEYIPSLKRCRGVNSIIIH